MAYRNYIYMLGALLLSNSLSAYTVVVKFTNFDLFFQKHKELIGETMPYIKEVQLDISLKRELGAIDSPSHNIQIFSKSLDLIDGTYVIEKQGNLPASREGHRATFNLSGSGNPEGAYFNTYPMSEKCEGNWPENEGRIVFNFTPYMGYEGLQQPLNDDTTNFIPSFDKLNKRIKFACHISYGQPHDEKTSGSLERIIPDGSNGNASFRLHFDYSDYSAKEKTAAKEEEQEKYRTLQHELVLWVPGMQSVEKISLKGMQPGKDGKPIQIPFIVGEQVYFRLLPPPFLPKNSTEFFWKTCTGQMPKEAKLMRILFKPIDKLMTGFSCTIIPLAQVTISAAIFQVPNSKAIPQSLEEIDDPYLFSYPYGRKPELSVTIPTLPLSKEIRRLHEVKFSRFVLVGTLTPEEKNDKFYYTNKPTFSSVEIPPKSSFPFNFSSPYVRKERTDSGECIGNWPISAKNLRLNFIKNSETDEITCYILYRE